MSSIIAKFDYCQSYNHYLKNFARPNRFNFETKLEQQKNYRLTLFNFQTPLYYNIFKRILYYYIIYLKPSENYTIHSKRKNTLLTNMLNIAKSTESRNTILRKLGIFGSIAIGLFIIGKTYCLSKTIVMN